MADLSEQELRAAGAAVIEPAPKRRRRSWKAVAAMLLVPLVLLGVGGYFWITSGRYVSTDNAYVQQDMVSISPDIAGRIVAVRVRENQRVEAGDILFTIDPDPYRIAVRQADAEIAEAELELSRARTTYTTSGVDITAAQEDIAFAESILNREQALMDRGFNTRARMDAARHSVADARERLRTALADQENARAATGLGPRQAYPA
ncbi:MAG: HlyD family secretion protein, partial [Sphingomonadaceae bacterium]|nr:HlyD family secretion protein [Sphingomonadaceae bacterium]